MFPRLHLDGPVAPECGIGAQVVGREEFTTVAIKDLVAALQSIEGVSLVRSFHRDGTRGNMRENRNILHKSKTGDTFRHLITFSTV